MYIIRQGVTEDIPAMTEIWIKSFGDSTDYIEHFMEKRLSSCTALVLEENGAIASQLFLLPGAMRVSGERLPALYLYAAATAPEHRGKGHMARLIAASKDFAEKGGYRFIALVPGEEELYGYYRRFGFYEAFSYRLRRLNRTALQKVAFERRETVLLSAAEMTAVRNARLPRSGAFLWDEKAVSFAVRQHCLGGGSVVCVPEAWALFYVQGGTVKIIELCAGKDGFGGIAKALLDETDADAFEFRVPSDSALDYEGFSDLGFFKGGMMIAVGGEETRIVENAYMGLSME